MNYDLLDTLFQAYFDVRKGKRNTVNQLRYELNMEHELLELYDDIVSRRYNPSRSICFLLTELEIKREIFGANFRDRIVHRLIHDQIAPLFERTFIADSYSCRKGMGTLYDIRRLDHHIRSCSRNYSRPCWVLKLDVQGYFFSIDRKILYAMLRSYLERHWTAYCAAQPAGRYMLDSELLFYLLERVIFHDATQNCIVRGSRKVWADFPPSKSLFHAAPDCGLPIGNLTSQLFSNIYMDRFDQWMKRELKVRHYGRYVDDFYIVHEDAGYLKSLIPVIRDFLREELHLTLHPRKIHLQRADRGVLFVGGYVKPGRIYPSHRVVSRFRQMLDVNRARCRKQQAPKFAASINSYLGGMKHFRCYRCRRRIIEANEWIYRYGWMRTDFAKFMLDHRVRAHAPCALVSDSLRNRLRPLQRGLSGTHENLDY